MIRLVPIVLIVAVVVGLASLFTVAEGEQVIVTRFGKPVGAPITVAGLHFKTPFVEDVRRFEKRVLKWDGDPNQIPTRDKKFIEIDTTARWRIADPLMFLQTVQIETRAQARLDDVLDAAARNAISSNDLIEAVRSTSRSMQADEDAIADEQVLAIEGGGLEEERAGRERILVGRRGLVQEILREATPEVAKLGIELIDFRIKKINYVEDVRRKVYDRMVSERKKIAERYRSEGRGKSSEIEGQREKELLTIRSTAYRTAQQIVGQGEAEATRLYAEAYQADPEFFAFLETLSTYDDVLDPGTTLVLSLDSELLRYLKGPQGTATGP